MLWFSQLLPILHIVDAGEPASQHQGRRAGFPAAPFGKTPGMDGLPEYDFPPAEFFFAHTPPGYVKIDVTGQWCGDLKN